MTMLLNLLGDLGFFVRRNLSSLGLAARMFAAVIARSGFLLKRPRLVIDQILFEKMARHLALENTVY